MAGKGLETSNKEALNYSSSFFISLKDTPQFYPYIKLALRAHPAFKKIFNILGFLNFKIPVWSRVDDAVLYAVIGQMLSVKAANSIICKLKTEYSTTKILNLASETYRIAGPLFGISQRKRKALACWNQFKNSPGFKKYDYSNCDLKLYRGQIESIWGFGRWSSDMLAIFHFGRMDIWPETDLGIQAASRQLFKKNSANIKPIFTGCETAAALYIWELINRGLIKENG